MGINRAGRRHKWVLGRQVVAFSGSLGTPESARRDCHSRRPNEDATGVVLLIPRFCLEV